MPYWDWAPPFPNRPWGRAFVLQQQAEHLPLEIPVGPGIAAQQAAERPATQRAFVDYIHHYDRTFAGLGRLAMAVRAVDPQAFFTTDSYGSSPGAGGRGGWPWATIPAGPLLHDLSVQMAYDWNERRSSKPLHNVALIDRARSLDPAKPTWALIDDFGFLFGREARQRAYALALTRGIQGIGTTFLAHTTAPEDGTSKILKTSAVGLRDRATIITEQRELYAWIHRLGGSYAMSEPLAPVGILFSHEQALSRRFDTTGTAGPHEGKVTEALFLCHMAGWPARVITAEELRRGVPTSMRAILLVGLNRFDDTWAWYEGLEQQLGAFVAAGGKLLLDNESVSPVVGIQTGLAIQTYETQRDVDLTPDLLERNHANAGLLRTALADVPPPVATSADETLWAVPTQAGNTTFVTAVNWALCPNDGREQDQTKPAGTIADQYLNASRYVQPRSGQLVWHTDRPIYDVRSMRRLTAQQACTVDLTANAFQYLALPERAVEMPDVVVQPADDGALAVRVGMGGTSPLTGIPVSLTLHGTTVYGATGTTVRLPMARGPAPQEMQVAVQELLSGLQRIVTITCPAATASSTDPAPTVTVREPEAVRRFTERCAQPLVTALTPTQAADPAIASLADRLMDFYTTRGRKVRIGRIGRIGLDDIVACQQPLQTPLRFPRWQTIAADLVLLGTVEDNVLLRDRAEGWLLPQTAPVPGHATIVHVWSAFVGSCNVVNLLAADQAGLEAAVTRLVGMTAD